MILKKFAKFLAGLAAVAGVCAGVYYFLEKKNLISCRLTDDEEDEDTAEEETDEDEKTSRTYVSLTKEKEGAEASKEEESHKEADASKSGEESAESTNVEDAFHQKYEA